MDFFYSDPHFGHSRVIEYCDRPWDNVDEMKEDLIANYNDTVSTCDTVVWLGDAFFCKSSMAKEILSRLKGKKILVCGNHDTQKPLQAMNLGFDFACHEIKTQIAGRPVTMSHYPYAPNYFERLFMAKNDLRYLDRRPVKNEWLLCGHVHTAWKLKDRQINVGVDVWDYAPVSREKIEGIIMRGTL